MSEVMFINVVSSFYNKIKSCFPHLQTIIHIEDCAVQLENPTDISSPPKTFTYDSSYGSNAPTEVIYNDICYSLVEVSVKHSRKTSVCIFNTPTFFLECAGRLQWYDICIRPNRMRKESHDARTGNGDRYQR